MLEQARWDRIIETNVENKTMTFMIACWYIWWSRRQIKHKEEVPTIDRTVLNIKGMVAYCARLRGPVNSIRRGGWMKPS
jgi:hypothetical protein